MRQVDLRRGSYVDSVALMQVSRRVEAREQLDAWLHQAVMTSGDAEALWAWINSPTGRDDIVAWKRLLSQLEFRDPRRSLCAARVGELRRSLA